MSAEDQHVPAIRIYLREIGEIPLLNREEEMRMAEKVAEGDEETRQQLIKANLRLVVKIAKKYEHLGLPFLDLIEEGNLGLVKAVERYDLSRGTKLSTYAAWWIKQSIMRALANQGKMIRIPVYMLEKISSLKKEVARLSQELGRSPAKNEIARQLGLSIKEIDYLIQVAQVPSSLDVKIDEEGITELAEIIQDTEIVPPDQVLTMADLKKSLLELLEMLSPREKKILEMRFGLHGYESWTLERIGEKFGISRERVRQIANKAIAKLREIIQERDMDF